MTWRAISTRLYPGGGERGAGGSGDQGGRGGRGEGRGPGGGWGPGGGRGRGGRGGRQQYDNQSDGGIQGYSRDAGLDVYSRQGRDTPPVLASPSPSAVFVSVTTKRILYNAYVELNSGRV